MTTTGADDKCTCQYGNDRPYFTPYWYITVKTCPRHANLYDAGLAPDWWDVERNEPRQ